ncbi:MAG: NAD(P)H-dependent glycerol-3-phosphate dehydrogenase [Bryobacteraceae bacterium]
MSALAIIGGGSWGTSLAVVLAPRFREVRLWMYEVDLASRLQQTRQNDIYLPGIPIPANVRVTTEFPEALREAEILLSVVPSAYVRRVYEQMRPWLRPDLKFVSATKGIENGTLLRMSEVIRQSLPFAAEVAVLSGPTFAREVAKGSPTATVVAAADPDLAKSVQHAFSGPTLRLYTNGDPVGVEVGGAIKNVVAIGAGVCQGLGLGSNALAALITRGLAEMTRLSVAMGGDARTLAGLAGLGDLVLTCNGELSRNRMVGMELAKGRTLSDIVGSTQMVAEGVETTRAAVALAERFSVDMPIVGQMNAMLHLGRSPADAIRSLMERTLKSE